MPEETPTILHVAGAVLAKYAGGVMKRVAESQFEGYGIRWHDPHRKDLQGEWFSPKTYLMRNAGYPVKGAPTNYQHGMQLNFGNLAVGLIQFADENEFGLFVQGELYTREQYIEMLKEIGRKVEIKFNDDQLAQKADLMVREVDLLLGKVPMQFSGGFDPSTWVVDRETKHIDQAGMIHLAFTPTPADDLNPLVRFKSALGEVLQPPSQPTYSIPDLPRSTVPTGGNAHNAANETQTVDTPLSETQQKGTATMWTKASVRETIRQTLDEVSQQELAALVQEIAAEVGVEVAPADAAAIAEEAAGSIETAVEEVAADETMMALPEEDMKSKKAILFKPVIQKHMFRAAYKHLGNRKRDAEAQRNKAREDARKEFQQQQPAKSATGMHTNPANSPLGTKDATTPQKAADVEVFSPYHRWSARDFSFALGIAQMQRNTSKRFLNVQVTQEFLREFGDKAMKAYQSGELQLDKETFQRVKAIKSDELSYSTQDGYGDELVPTIWSGEIWEKPRQDNVIANVFEMVEMPSNPYEYPVESTDPTVKYVAETKHDAQLSLDSTTRPIGSSKPGTNKVTFNAKKFGLALEWSAELQEDAIARLVPKYREQAERAMQDQGVDGVAINGDTSTTTNINADGETITATDRNYLAYDGLIHQALVTATTNRLDASGAAPTIAHLRAVRALLGTAEAANPDNLVWIMDTQTYLKLLSDDVVLTVDKYGAQATVLTGELGRIDGIPIKISAQMVLADADGKITQAGNSVNRGRAVLVHRPSWKMGYRRRVSQSLDFVPYFDTWILTITMRNHFLPRSATDGTLQSTDDSVGILYNIGV